MRLLYVFGNVLKEYLKVLNGKNEHFTYAEAYCVDT